MLTPTQAIELGVKKYLHEYEDAIIVLWKHPINQEDKIKISSFLIAQAVQESRFNPLAVSLAGAVGIAQFMPSTAKDIEKELKDKLSLFKDGFDRKNPEQSIWAQVYYMNKLFKNWDRGRSTEERFKLAFASYNAGLGMILSAQKKSGDKMFWKEIKEYLDETTGDDSKETLTYVDNIMKYAVEVEKFANSLKI